MKALDFLLKKGIRDLKWCNHEVSTVIKWLEEYAKKMCVKQRENCADAYMETSINTSITNIQIAIQNTPMPKELY